MKKLKQLFISLGLGAMFLFGTGAAVSAAAEGELEGAVKAQAAEQVFLEDYDLPAAKALGTPATNSVTMTKSSLTSISLQWGKVSGANGFRVFIGPYKSTTNSEFNDLGVTRSPSCKITKILPGTPYTIRLQSVKIQKVDGKDKIVDKAGKYLRFNVVTKTPSVNKVSTDKNGKFTIRMYNPAPSDTADDIVGYRVNYENITTHAKATRYYDKSRTGFTYTPKQNYFYKLTITPYIRATDKAERKYGKPSITQYIAQQPKLSKRGNTASSQTISWNKVNGANGYKIYVRYPGTTSYKLVKKTTGLSYSLTGIKKGKDYLIKVVAFRGSFNSASSTYYRIRL